MTTIRNLSKYGHKRDILDPRDLHYKPTLFQKLLAPNKVDLSPNFAPVYNQLSIGSCTSQALAGADQFLRTKEGLDNFIPSRLFLYYNERVIEGTVDQDAGAMLRDGIKVLANKGVCPETLWPYKIAKFAVKPPAKAYAAAKNHLAIKYMRVEQKLSAMKACLASGLPFVFGFTVYSYFESDEMATTGQLKMPKTNEEVLGGHAVCCVGYDSGTKNFLCRNSWGSDWSKAMNGYFWMPFAYMLDPNLTSDHWVIQASK